LTSLNLAAWLLSARFTAAAPGATEFLGDALSAYEKGRATAKEVSVFVLAFGVLWKLILVAVLVVVAVWILRRTLKIGGIPVSTPGAVKVLAVTHLDARRTVYLLEVGERILIVGAGGESMSLLADITSPAEKTAIREQLQEGGSGRFASYLSAWTARMAGGGEARQQMEEGKGFLADRLKAMRKRRESKGEPGEREAGE